MALVVETALGPRGFEFRSLGFWFWTVFGATTTTIHYKAVSLMTAARRAGNHVRFETTSVALSLKFETSGDPRSNGLLKSP